jgi:hypothetical protein
MWISLERFAACNPQEHFIIHFPGWFELQTLILAHLTPSESHLYLRTCIFLIVETRELTLTATAVRIHYSGSGFSVPTPPVQPALQLAGQGGGVWDQEFSSSSSAESENVSHAVEIQYTD